MNSTRPVLRKRERLADTRHRSAPTPRRHCGSRCRPRNLTGEAHPLALPSIKTLSDPPSQLMPARKDRPMYHLITPPRHQAGQKCWIHPRGLVAGTSTKDVPQQRNCSRGGLRMDFTCPHCHRLDFVQNVPALHADGVSTSHGTDLYSGVGLTSIGLVPVFGTATVERIHTTELAHGEKQSRSAGAGDGTGSARRDPGEEPGAHSRVAEAVSAARRRTR